MRCSRPNEASPFRADDVPYLCVKTFHMFTNYITELSPHCIFGDKRLSLRFLSILEAKIKNISLPLTRLFSTPQESRQAYDFFRNAKVTFDAIIANERARLIHFVEQMKPAMMFVIQDTTTLDFSNARSADNLDCLQTAYQKGVYLHSSLVLNALGVPMGLLDQYFWSRGAYSFGIKKSQRKQLPIEEKESFRWLSALRLSYRYFAHCSETMIVNLMDREGDIYDLFLEERPANAHYVIRARGDRKSISHDLTIRPTLDKMIPDAEFCYEIPVKSIVHSSQTRKANLEVRYSKMLIRQPSTQTKKSPVDIWVLWIREINCPQGETPVDWLLFTSIPIHTSDDANNIVRYYTYRWRIEQLHKVLKTDGAQITTVQFEEEQTLKSAISAFSIASVQVLHLQYTSKEEPEKPLEELGIQEDLYRIGAQYLNKVAGTKLEVDKLKPTITDLLRVVGHLAGFSFQKGKNMGTKTIRHGLSRLLDIKTVVDALMSG
jgi:hypothetical protein